MYEHRFIKFTKFYHVEKCSNSVTYQSELRQSLFESIKIYLAFYFLGFIPDLFGTLFLYLQFQKNKIKLKFNKTMKNKRIYKGNQDLSVFFYAYRYRFYFYFSCISFYKNYSRYNNQTLNVDIYSNKNLNQNLVIL